MGNQRIEREHGAKMFAGKFCDVRDTKKVFTVPTRPRSVHGSIRNVANGVTLEPVFDLGGRGNGMQAFRTKVVDNNYHYTVFKLFLVNLVLQQQLVK